MRTGAHCLLAIVLVVGSTGCRKPAEQTPPRRAPASKPAPREAPKPAVGAGCELPLTGAIRTAFRITKGCKVKPRGTIRVLDGAALTIEPGVTVEMPAATMIEVEKGTLVARGTEAEPIVFASAAKTPAAADWGGIVLGEGTGAGTVLDHVRVSHAGAKLPLSQGGITVRAQRSRGRIAITQSVVESCGQSGISVESPGSTFAKFEHNRFSNNPVSITLPADVLGSVGAENVFIDPISTFGIVADTVAWPVVDVPILLPSGLAIGGTGKAPASLTIPPNTIVKVGPGKRITVGERDGGTLIAKAVTFTSVNSAPRPGDWVGLFLHERAVGVDLSGATVEFAGGAPGHAAITISGVPAKKLAGLKASGMKFRQNVRAAVSSSDGVCAAFQPGAKTEGSPLCKKG